MALKRLFFEVLMVGVIIVMCTAFVVLMAQSLQLMTAAESKPFSSTLVQK